MADDKITGKDLIDDSAFSRLEKLDTLLAGIISRFSEIEKSAQRAFSGNQLNQASREIAKETDKATEALKEQSRIEKALIREREKSKLATSDVNKELIRQRLETQAINQSLKRQATSTSQAVGAYKRLSTELAIAKDRLKDIIIEQGQFSEAARRQQLEVDKLAGKIKTADNAAGDFQRNVGNYPSALRGAVSVLRQLVGAFGLVEGIRLGVRFLRDAAELSREARGVTFAFERLGDQGVTALEAVRESTRGLISDLDIQKSLVDFRNFNIDLEQSAVLFEFLAIRAAQTGKNIDLLRDSLVEGLSKESKLRIDNLGISVIDLNAELEKTPNFVQAVANIAKREIAEAGNILDDASNGAARFNASFQNLQVAIGDVVTKIKGLGAINDVIELGVTNTRLWNELLFENGDALGFLQSVIRTVTPAGIVENKRLLEEIEYRKTVVKEIDNQVAAYIRLNGTLGPLTEEQQRKAAEAGSGGSILFNPAKGQEVILNVGEITEEIKRLTEELDKQSTRSGAEPIQQKIKDLEAQRDAILGVVDAQKKSRKEEELLVEILGQTSERQLTNTINNLKAAQSQVDIGSRQWKEYADAIKFTQDQLDLLNQTFVDGIPKLADIVDPEDLAIYSDVQNFLNTEGLDVMLQDLAAKLGTTQAKLTDEFETLYERDFENFKKFAELKIEQDNRLKQQREANLMSTIETGVAFAEAVLEIQSQRAEEELERQNRVFDSIIQSKTASEEQIAIAEKKRLDNELRIEKEREKRQRKAFLIQQAVEVAKVLIQRSVASAAAFAPPPVGLGPLLGATLLPGININAALAVATILAQSIPKFFKGKSESETYTGRATVNELPGQREIRVGEQGNIELFGPGVQTTYVKSRDIILDSIPEFIRKVSDPNTSVFKRVRKNMKDQTDARSALALSSGFTPTQATLMVNALRTGIVQGFRGVQPPNIVLPKERRRYSR